MKKGLQQVVIQYTQQADLLNKINVIAGILGELSAGFREEITNGYPDAWKIRN